MVTHGFIKRGTKVPAKEIRRAKVFRRRWHADPVRYTHKEG